MSVRLQLDTSVRRFSGGRVLLGGAPTRLLRLREAGAQLLDGWLAGQPVGSDRHEQALARRMLDAGIVHPAPTADGHRKTAVTVVVPVRNNSPGLTRLLLATADVPHRIVVDDASQTPIADAAVRHEFAQGPAAARNAGWRCATTPFIAFLDSDTIPDARWLDHVLPLFDDPAVAAVAPRVRCFGTGAVGEYESHRSSLDMGSEPAAVRPDGRVRYVPTAALVVRRAALEALDGFDDSLRFGEDVDLVWRLVGAGYTVRYQPLSLVHHQPRNTVVAWLRQRFDYGTSAAPLAQRHPGYLHSAYLPRMFGLQLLVATVGHPAIAALPSVVSTTASARRLNRRGIPRPTAAATSITKQFSLIQQIGDALRRVWWPLALCTSRGRRWLVVACTTALVPAISHRRGLRWAALRLLDDLAYGAGVWAGCLRHRTLEPILPRFDRFPSSSP